MKIYNTLTRKKEDFVPIEEGKVGIYVCGPTVYDYIHIGNARPLVTFDCLHRYFIAKGYKVKYVVNFTDIDDKIINRAREEGVGYKDISEKYIKAFMDQAESLNLLESETIHPRATDMLEEIVDFISGLIEKGAAYDAEDAVYFKVSKAKDYGKLSGKNIDDLISGARIRVNEAKEDPLDFALWKKQKESWEPAWSSPWGPGRPGWHIECSTMSKSILGETIDIHAGGSDLEFPHHENEIAQSETLTDKTFARYWMHNAMITVSDASGAKEKMSKSKGNFFTLKDIEKEYDLILVRLWLISAHYRSPINFSRTVMEATKNSYDRLMNAKDDMERLLDHSKSDGKISSDIRETAEASESAFNKAMEDDLNTADALSAIFDLARLANSRLNEESSSEDIKFLYDLYMKLLNILGIEDRRRKVKLDQEIEALIKERDEARKAKNFQRADEIRDLLVQEGIELKDTPTGVVWTRKA